LREQVVTPRASVRAGAASRGRSSGITQKPARRGANSRSGGSTLRTVLSYMPVVGKVLLAIITGVLIFAGYRAAASASFFEARNIDINGATHVSADDVKALVRRAASGKGVWRAELNVISAEVEKLPWVRKAVVSRVLPDGLRVRIVERVPRAVVHTSAGRFVWVDEDAVALSQMLPSDPMPAFFLRGWDESGTSEARAENRERVQKYLLMASEWQSLGLSERVSEVNLGDAHDVRALLAGDDAHIEVRLGEKNFGPRLQKALKVLDEQRATPLGPFITYLVANQDGKITVGHSANAPTVAKENDDKDAVTENDVAVVKTDTRATPPPAKRSREAGERESRASEAQKKKEREKKEKTPGEARRETRPRRVG
jgi:hypothetical protein